MNDALNAFLHDMLNDHRRQRDSSVTMAELRNLVSAADNRVRVAEDAGEYLQKILNQIVNELNKDGSFDEYKEARVEAILAEYERALVAARHEATQARLNLLREGIFTNLSVNVPRRE